MATDGKPDVKSQSERARSFIGGLIKMFEVRIEEEAAGAAAMQPRAKGAGRVPSAPPVPPTAAAPSDRKYASFTEALAPFKERFEQAAKVDSSQLDEERKAEVAVKKKAMATHLAASRDLYKQPAGEAEALKELSRANQAATELLTRRYRIDPRTAKQYEEKELSPTYEAGERREFVGKELRANYKNESRTGYENAAKQAQTADYMLSDGLIRDAQGRPVTATGADAMYTSRLDDGTSHRFHAAGGHHSFAAEGTATIGAGSRVVVDGVVRTVTGDSGHYTPSAKNIHEYVEGMIEQGVKMIDDVTLFVPDPTKPGAHRPLGPEDKAVYDDFRSVVDYYRTRAEKRRAGEDPGEFDRAIQGKIQKLGDREVFPGRKDAKVETLVDGYLVNPSEWDKPNKDGVVLTGGAKAVEMIAKRLKTVYLPAPGKDGKNVFKAVPINAKNVPLLFNGLPHTKKKVSTADDLTTDDVNHLLGIAYRLGWDKPPGGESPVRIEMDAQRFVQTGGNAEAIGAKQEFRKELNKDRAARAGAFADFKKERAEWIAAYRLDHPEASDAEVLAAVDEEFAERRAEHLGFDEEANTRTGKLYADLGGDETLKAEWEIHEPEKIETDLKYAWLVKGRITDDRRLDDLLLARTGAQPADQWAVLEAPLEVKLQMLQDAAAETFLARVAAGKPAAQPAPIPPAAPPIPAAPPPAAAGGSGAGGASPNQYAMPAGMAPPSNAMPAAAAPPKPPEPSGSSPNDYVTTVRGLDAAPIKPEASAAQPSSAGPYADADEDEDEDEEEFSADEEFSDDEGDDEPAAEAPSSLRGAAPNDYVTTVKGLDEILGGAGPAAAGPAAGAPSGARSAVPNDYVTTVQGLDEAMGRAGPAASGPVAGGPSGGRSVPPTDYITTVQELDEIMGRAKPSSTGPAAEAPAGLRSSAPNDYVTTVQGLDEAMGRAGPSSAAPAAGGPSGGRSVPPTDYITTVQELDEAMGRAGPSSPAPAAGEPSGARSAPPTDYVTTVQGLDEAMGRAGPAAAGSAAEAPSGARSAPPNDYVTTVKGLDELLEDAEINLDELDDLESAFNYGEDSEDEEDEPTTGAAEKHDYVSTVKNPSEAAESQSSVELDEGEDEDEDEDDEDSEPLAARAPEPAARPAPPAEPRRDEPERLEKIDLRKVKKGTKVDPNRKAYEELGGDTALLEQLLEAWDRNNAATVGRLKELEKARNQLKQRLKGAAELEPELKKLDAEQADERKTLKAKLDATRPVLADLSGKWLSAELKIDLLRRPERQAEVLTAIAERRDETRSEE